MCRALLPLLLGSTLGIAQAPAPTAAIDVRGNAIGEVRDAGGKAWVGAEVVLVARPLRTDVVAGEVDRVVARVDERGRFKVPVLRGRPYSAWAWGEANEKGRPASAVVENVFVGQPILLRHERELPVRELVVEHVERWPGATLRARVIDELGNHDLHVVDVRDGRARLPWLVGAQAAVELFAVDGETWNPLAFATLPATSPSLQLALPEKTRITCFVRGGKEPIAGARVLRGFGDTMHFVGTTDAAGTLSLDVGADPAHGITTQLDSAEGPIGGFLAVASITRMKGTAPDGARPTDLVCDVDAARPTHIRLVAGASPLAGAELVCAGNVASRPSKSSAGYHPWVRAVRADGEGRAVVRSERNGVNAHVLLRERDLAVLPARWRQGLAPLVFAPLKTAVGKGTIDDPLVVDLARLCPIELTFTGPGGTPLVNVEVLLGALDGVPAWWPAAGGSPALSDERGRVRMLVPAEQPLGLRARHGMSVLVRAFVTTPARGDAGPAVASFELPAPTGIRGRLLAKDGSPAVGRRVFGSFGTDNVPAEWDFASEPEAKLAVPGNALRVFLPEELSQLRLLTNLFAVAVPVDAEGRFALPLPAVPLPGLLLFQHRGARDAAFDSHPVPWTGEAIDDLEWTIRS